MAVLIAVVNRRCPIILSEGTDEMFLVLISAGCGDIFNLKCCVKKVILGSLHSFEQNISAEIIAGQFLQKG